MARIYFDFHTPELYECLPEDNWSKWYSRLVRLELEGKESYFFFKVSDALIDIEKVSAIMDVFLSQYNGTLLNKKNITEICKVWEDVWIEVAPTELFNPNQIHQLMNNYIGFHFVIRIE